MLFKIILLLVLSSVMAQAQFTFSRWNLDGTMGNTEIRITGYKGFTSEVNIPSTYFGLPVTSINSMAFIDWGITSVTIPDSVIGLWEAAFQRCACLTNVVIGSNVVFITNAFIYCPELTVVFFQGNAPSVDPNGFVGSEKVVVYYLQGTTGWKRTFGGRPTIMLPRKLPPMETNIWRASNNNAT